MSIVGIKKLTKSIETVSDFQDNRKKTCPNCGTRHTGMFDDCYSCYDCETEYEYNARKEEALKRGSDV